MLPELKIFYPSLFSFDNPYYMQFLTFRHFFFKDEHKYQPHIYRYDFSINV